MLFWCEKPTIAVGFSDENDYFHFVFASVEVLGAASAAMVPTVATSAR
jgi:hypothetical protein